MYIEKELVESRIAILRGKGSENNRLVLKILTSRGPVIKYDLFKALNDSGKKSHYPTVSRRVDDLLSRGYLEKVGKRTIVVGKRKDESPTYGITWKGFIASLTIEPVAQNILRVLEMNQQLELPFPRVATLRIIRELFTDRELELIGQALLTGYLKAIPKDLESLKPEQYLMYLLPALTEAPQIREKFEQKDLSGLLQIPEVFEFVSKSINDAEKMLEESLSGIRELKKYLNAGKHKAIKPIVSKTE